MEIDVWDGEERKSERGGEGEHEHERLRDRIAERLHRRSASHGRGEIAVAVPETNEGGKQQYLAPEKANVAAATAAAAQIRREPRVLHGHTLTKEVSFRDVCITIRDAAFKTR